MSKFTQFLKSQFGAYGAAANFSRATGIGDAAISKWISGRSLPDFESTLRIALYFRINPVILFDLMGKGDLSDLYRSFLPDYTPSQISAEAFYRRKDLLQVHQALDRICDVTDLARLTVLLEALFEILPRKAGE